MKKKIYLSIALIGLMVQQSLSQCTGVLPVTNDRIARPSTSSCNTLVTPITTTTNTGYDVFWDGAANCQVMVWDGTNASFSWDYGAVGSIAFSSIAQIGTAPTLDDPDVVVQRIGGQVYAMFVGIAKTTTVANNNKVFWASYRWNAGAFVYNTSGFLGSNTNNTACFNPNIDVNGCGKVVVTWHYERTENITITTSGTGYTFGPVVQPVLRADVYGAYGQVDGACTIKGAVTLSGDLISDVTAVDHLFEKNTTPDVCISDYSAGSCNGGTYYFTYTWVQTWFDPATFTYKSDIVVKQYVRDISNVGCVTAGGGATGYYRQLDFLGQAGRPRIAARPTINTVITHYTDFQVVMAFFNIGCTVSNILNCPASCGITSPLAPYKTGVLNWGRHNSVDNPTLVATNLTVAPVSPCDLTNYFYNNNAVVSYLSTSFGTAGDYSVAWEHGPNPLSCAVGISSTTGVDIVARTYNDGASIGAAPRYSIINKNPCNVNNQTGAQTIPSIGARHAVNQLGFAFWDNQIVNRYYIGYKATSAGNIPGSGFGLRVGNTDTGDLIESPEEKTGSYNSIFNAYPNPFSNDVTFYYNLPESDQALEINIYDTKGFVVEKIKLENSSGSKSVMMNHPSGVYIAKLKSKNGEFITKLTKSN